MKKIPFLLFILAASLFSACDKHDNLSDILIVGQKAPQVYWEISSTTVTAGKDVTFAAQYYTTGKAELSHLEVWYDVREYLETSVSCSWLSTAWSKAANSEELKRQFQMISEYPHQESYWTPELRAYEFKASFPTSVTLGTFEWKNPETFDDSDLERVRTLFGETFPEDFQNEVYGRMREADFVKMFQGLGVRDLDGVPINNFRERYSVEFYNEFTGLDEWGFPENPVGSGNRPVPAEVREIYYTIPFSDLILNTDVYGIVYVRSYKVNAYLKAIDAAGNSGKTTINPAEPNITLN